MSSERTGTGAVRPRRLPRPGGRPGRLRAAGWAAALGIAVSVAACGAAPAPRILSVTPQEIVVKSAGRIQISGTGFFAVLRATPWSAAAPVLDTAFTVRIDDQALPAGAVAQLDAGALSAQLPATLALGAHRVTVVTPDGLEATLADAFWVESKVVPALTLETAGDGTGAPATSLAFAPGGPGASFYAVLRSGSGRFLGLSPASWLLEGTAGVVAVSGDRTSASFRPTVSGEAIVQATTDDGKLSARSGTLSVRSGPLRLAFASAPRQVAAGSCSGEVAIELRDSSHTAFTFPDGATVALSGAGVTLFSDPTCTRQIATLSAPPSSLRMVAHVRSTRAGSRMLNASAIGLGVASQPWTVIAGAPAGLSWDPLPSGLPAGQEIPAGVSSVDAFGNLAAVDGPASLSITAPSAVECGGPCASPSSPTLSGGRWSGTVRIQGPAALAQRLTIALGGVSASSSPFTLWPARSAPTARISFAPAVATVSEQVTFDASASSDAQTPATGLQFSWDATGAATPPPWSPWSASPILSLAFDAGGAASVRVAVRDGDGDVGVAVVGVQVVATAAAICQVRASLAAVDDGATSCSGPFGSDGLLSLAEALRLSDASPGTVVTLAPGLVVRGPAAFYPAAPVTLTGGAASQLADVTLGLRGGVLRGLSITGTLTGAVSLSSGGSLLVEDVDAHDLIGFSTAGQLSVRRSRFSRCAGACIRVDGANAQLTLRQSELSDSPTGLALARCATGGVDVLSSVFVRLGAGATIAGLCGATSIQHVTFDANTVGLDYQGGSGHLLRNGIFTGNQTGATCSGSPSGLGVALELWGNAADGCLGFLPSPLRADPRYLFSATGDYRLEPTSPAVDAAISTGADVNDAAPGLFQGAGPDLGGRESW